MGKFLKGLLMKVKYLFCLLTNFIYYLGRPHGKGKLRIGSNVYNVEFDKGNMKKKIENK